jgi:hypothetical protein
MVWGRLAVTTHSDEIVMERNRQSADRCAALSPVEIETMLKQLRCSWVQDYGPAKIWQTARGFRFTVEEQCKELSWKQILSEIAPYL